MKIHALSVLTIILSTLCLEKASAEEYVCPEGCFCLDNGKHHPGYVYVDDWCGRGARAIEKSSNVWDSFSKQVAKNNTELDELYVLEEEVQNGTKIINVYGIKGDVFYEDDRTANRHVCPITHPHSAKGSKAITDCFYSGVGGKKIYYTFPSKVSYSGNCDISAFAAGLEALQKKLDQANELAADLQNALNNANAASQTNKGSSKSNNNASSADIENMKAAISVGISDKKSIDNQSTLSKPAKSDIEGAKALIRAGVTETHGAVKAAKRTHN